MTLYFNCSPEELDEEQVLDYLQHLKTLSNTPSSSYFKHTVYGLRFAYKVLGIAGKRVFLPSLKLPKKLPVVLSHREVKQLLKAPQLLKHRLVLAMLYGCGLRRSELLNIKLPDIDLDRRVLHICEGKGRKDRYVVLSKLLVKGIAQYLAKEQPQVYLFNGQVPGEPMGERSIQWIINEAVERAGIKKPTTCHTLRHTFATHLLENGADLFSIKEQLGHARIETTLVYLHIAQFTPKGVKSPLDDLYKQ